MPSAAADAGIKPKPTPSKVSFFASTPTSARATPTARTRSEDIQACSLVIKTSSESLDFFQQFLGAFLYMSQSSLPCEVVYLFGFEEFPQAEYRRVNDFEYVF